MYNMDISNFIRRVALTKYHLSYNVTIPDDFDNNSLRQLCNINISGPRLNEAWCTIINAATDKFYDVQKQAYDKLIKSFLPNDVISFLLDNSIALVDIAHLPMNSTVLKSIVEKLGHCSEAEMQLSGEWVIKIMD